MKKSASEITFSQQWVQRRVASFLHYSYGVVSIAHLVSAILVPGLAKPPVSRVIFIYHTSALVLALGGWLCYRLMAVHRAVICALLMSSSLFFLGLVYYVTHWDVSVRNLLLSTIGATIYAIFGILTYPGRLWHVALLMVVLASASLAAIQPIPDSEPWAAIYIAGLPLALMLRSSVTFIARRVAANEYRFRVLVAPAHIARLATGDADELAVLFKPREAPCVCLSSDWRNYQALSADLTPIELGAALDAYYELCQKLLRRHMPLGNYYTDWIADELFIVFYADDSGDVTPLVDVALAFARDLVEEKQGFAALHGQPRAIDIGLSFGSALLGLMGPTGYKKATALGEVPGRARRMQSAGKLIRNTLGQADRIVFGYECMVHLRQVDACRFYELPAGETLRDIQDRGVYYVEQAALGSDHAPAELQSAS